MIVHTLESLIDVFYLVWTELPKGSSKLTGDFSDMRL